MTTNERSDLLDRHLEGVSEDFTLAEILEMCDLPESEALKILYYGGYIDLPHFLRLEDVEFEDVEDT